MHNNLVLDMVLLLHALGIIWEGLFFLKRWTSFSASLFYENI